MNILDNTCGSNHNRSLPEDTNPVQIPSKLDIARKPKIVPTPTTNGYINGHCEPSSSKRKRSLEDDVKERPKRSKTQVNVKAEASQSDDVIIEDDGNNGAIVIDSD